jgi:hypothetical protein
MQVEKTQRIQDKEKIKKKARTALTQNQRSADVTTRMVGHV